MDVPATPQFQASDTREALNALLLEVFRSNSRLVAAGDALVQDLGLTAARWQVLGAIHRSPVPLPVAHLARNLGLARQSVQRVVDEMRSDGLLRLEPNPHHRRALLVVMTGQGEAAYREAGGRQAVWADALAAGLSVKALKAAATLLHELQQRLCDGAEHHEAD